MIARGRVAAPQKQNALPAGLHLVIVKDIQLSKDSQKRPLLVDGAPIGIDVTFEDKDQRSYVYRFLLRDSERWQVDKFCDAINVSSRNNTVSKSDVIGKRLFIHIIQIFYKCEDQVLRINKTKMIPKFRPFILGMRPTIEGDPAVGSLGGEFVEYEEVDETTFNKAKDGRPIFS